MLPIEFESFCYSRFRPYEMWHGKLVNYENLKVFVCLTYAHVSQGKLARRARKFQFISYPDGVKGFKLWCTDLNLPKCVISRDVVFNKNVAFKIKGFAEHVNNDDRDKTWVQFKVEHTNKKITMEDENSEHSCDDHKEIQDTHSKQDDQTQVQNY